jgi:sorting nexin-7/30/sorting nexin-8
MSDDLEAKQQYLRSEIIDQGYNPEDFSTYMGNIRGEEGLNIENWTFSDLQLVVSQFKSDFAQYQQQQQQIEQPEQNEIQNEDNNNLNNQNVEEGHEQQGTDDTVQENSSKICNPVPNNSSSSKECKFPNDPFEKYEEIIPTVKLESNDITEKNDLYVTVSNPVKAKDGFFSSSYYNYTIKTSPVGYSVVRKLSDFTFLYEILPIINSGVFNPVLPHFEFGLKDDSPKKMLYIQNYLNSLIENKFFRTLPIVFDFLTLPQDKWNKLRLEKYSKIKPPSLSNMPTLEGELHIKISKSEDNKGLKIKDAINKKTEAYDTLNNAMDELLTTIDKLSSCYRTLAKSLLDLTKYHKDNQILYGFFNRLLSLTKTWARDYYEEGNFLKDEFKYFFKFINKENVSFLKKYDEFKLLRDEYKSKYDKVKKLPTRTKKDLVIINNLRRDYGLELLMVNNEYQKLLERQANRCTLQFMKYNNKKDVILQNFNKCEKLFNINEQSNDIEATTQQEQNETSNEYVGENNEENK